MVELGEYTLPFACKDCGSPDLQLRILADGKNSQVKIKCYECGKEEVLRKNKSLDRRTGNPINRWAREVKARDGYKCQDCGSTEDLEAHHIKPWSECEELRLDVSNGITLCHTCHVKRHGFDYRERNIK